MGLPGFNPQLHVGYIYPARTSSYQSTQFSENITCDQIVRFTGTRHGKDFSIDVFMADFTR